MRTKIVRSAAVLAVLAVAVASTPLIAQDAAGEPSQDLSQLWEDFVHYVKIARPEVARSYAEAILQADPDPREVYLLASGTTNYLGVLSRAANQAELQPLVEQLREVIKEGYQELRSDPEQIAESIEMLGGNVRQYAIGLDRLQTSGEFALPQLIQKLYSPETDDLLRERITVALPRLGRSAVRPLMVALQTEDDRLARVLADALARIEYPLSAPRLKELAQREDVLAQTRDAARRALVIVAGRDALNKSAGELFYEQALTYYYERESVRPDPREEMANVWFWKEGLGLEYVPVPREIFCEIYAMRMARETLRYDEGFYPAVSLWIGSNLKRAAELPEGAEDPLYGDALPPAEYYALAGGAQYLQQVLARALNDRNSAVAVGAIEALTKTAGAKNMVSPVEGGAQPLVAALGYGDRHVRFLAAESLALALPEEAFAGSDLVMGQLIEALRQTGGKTAIFVATGSAERDNTIKDALRGAGYEIVEGESISAAMAEARDVAGVDVAVVGSSPDAIGAVRAIRADTTYAMTPVTIVGASQAIRDLAERDELTLNIADPGELSQTLDEARQLLAGRAMTPEAASEWAVRAAEAIHRLGVTGNRVYDISRAEAALIENLDDEREPVRLAASAALAVMRSAQAQRAVAELANEPATPETVRIASYKDLASSLRLYGNQLTEQQSQATVEVVGGNGSTDLLTAAAGALGAMNLPTDQVKVLILDTGDAVVPQPAGS